MTTKQELFETVINHLAKQKAQSLDEIGECVYRGENGKSCAVGCLIKNEHYNEDLEGFCVKARSVELALKKSVGRVSSQALDMLSDLQDFHDNHYKMSDTDSCADPVQYLKDICEEHAVKLPKGTEDLSWV